jgi:hypothetical protein
MPIMGIDFNVKKYKKMKYIRKFNEGKNITDDLNFVQKIWYTL